MGVNVPVGSLSYVTLGLLGWLFSSSLYYSSELMKSLRLFDMKYIY